MPGGSPFYQPRLITLAVRLHAVAQNRCERALGHVRMRLRVIGFVWKG
jgi:hypothetical protein